jgi:2-oxoglutarate ferredoxin oxidoreductase subunit alpha
VEVDAKQKVGIIAFGSSHFAIRESMDQMRNEYKLAADYLRLRAYPFSREVHDFIAAHERVYVVEQNRDAQMLSLLKLDLPHAEAGKLRSVRHYNGLPLDARSVTDEIISQEGL